MACSLRQTGIDTKGKTNATRLTVKLAMLTFQKHCALS